MKKRVIEFILLTVFAVLFLSGCKKNVGTPEDNPVVEEDEESVEPAKDYLYGDPSLGFSTILFWTFFHIDFH